MTKYNLMDNMKKADEADAKAVEQAQAQQQKPKKYNLKEAMGEDWTWGDVGRAAAQGATLDYADEIAARAKSLMPGGKSYEEELKAQHESIDESKRRLGKGYDVANIAGGVATMFVPGLGLVRAGKVVAGLNDLQKARVLAGLTTKGRMAVQAGDKLNKMGRTGRMVVGGAGIAAADDIGKQRGDIDVNRALKSAALGGATGGAISGGIGAVNALRFGGGVVADTVRGALGKEASHFTKQRALTRSAKALQKSGSRTAGDLEQNLQSKAFLQERPNGTYAADTAAPVQALSEPEFAKFNRAAGEVTEDMRPVVNEYERSALQQGNRLKSEVMKDELLRSGGAQDTRTYLNRQSGQLESLGQQLDNFRAANKTQYVELPGLRRLFREQPALAEDLWRKAKGMNISRPGNPRIPDNIMPVTPREAQGLTPAQLNARPVMDNDGMPLGQAMNIRDAIREMMQTEPARGQMVMEALLGRRIRSNSLVGEFNRLFSARRGVHEGTKAADIGRGVAGAGSESTAKKLSDIDQLGASEFSEARKGYLQGLAHKLDDAKGDVRDWWRKNLGTSDQRQAFMDLVHNPNHTGMPIEQLRHNVQTLAERQNIFESMTKANRKVGSELESQAVKDTLTRYSYSAPVAAASAMGQFLKFAQRGPKIQNAEQVRIMLNTTREGRRLLQQELTRLNSKGHMGGGDVANLIANQLAMTIWDKMQSAKKDRK